MNKLALFFFFVFGSSYLYAGEINVNGKSVNYSGQHTAHWVDILPLLKQGDSYGG